MFSVVDALLLHPLSYEKPEEVMRWYYQNPERLREVESVVLENNVVGWVLSNAKVTDKDTPFEELTAAIQDSVLNGSHGEKIRFVYIGERGQKSHREHAFEGILSLVV